MPEFVNAFSGPKLAIDCGGRSSYPSLPYPSHESPTMKRRRFLARFGSLPALAAVPWLAACGPARPLAVGIHPWIGYETLHLAREFGGLPASVELAEGKTQGDSQSALKAGKIGAACLTLDEVLVARAAGRGLLDAVAITAIRACSPPHAATNSLRIVRRRSLSSAPPMIMRGPDGMTGRLAAARVTPCRTRLGESS